MINKLIKRLKRNSCKENSNLTIPRALSGACFHGEVWVKCPHCMSGNQMMGKKELYKQDGYSIYKCDECGKLFKDR